ncbi:dual specificity phosphatase Yvh1 [Penicillium cf. griseofulvum]|uniref:protein-tyrosine-phosphatase n=1 Tax=Penicillium cf. griseofulvum TaxID=2972120 RepID=A0A9W9J8K2_9EURO|nr:dual specificity phosphatase Yvh1 [Penicillium cf. griseofulvum]KAJ5427852.1 dual specificity phosphatase Yvh1 [Penicillium cf. griseofulvum]KAJ5432056.1 dual specificity phosphatase Yvh1 [Penicillium cf. griseofulvum]
MCEDAAGKDTEDERNKKWEMAFTARMRQIVRGLFLGNVKASYDRDLLQKNRINTIVSFTDARWVQCADSSTQDLLAYMSDICDFIDRIASPALSSLSSLPVNYKHATNYESCGVPSDAILIHCDLGISRSPTIVVAYLMRKLGMQKVDVLNFVQSRQKVKPSPNLTRQLQVWEEVGYQVWENEDKTVPKAPYKAFLEDRADLLKKGADRE